MKKKELLRQHKFLIEKYDRQTDMLLAAVKRLNEKDEVIRRLQGPKVVTQRMVNGEWEDYSWEPEEC